MEANSKNLIIGATTVMAQATWDDGAIHTKEELIDDFCPKTASVADKALSCFGFGRNSVTQRREWSVLPLGFDRLMGRMMYPGLIDSNGGLSTDRTKKALVQSIVSDLKPLMKHQNFAWDIQVVSSGVMNAMALPGGKIVICEGIIDEITNHVQGMLDGGKITEAQAHKKIRSMLALVIGHEMAHSDVRHGAQSIQRTILVYIVLAIFFAVAKLMIFNSKSNCKTQEERNRLDGLSKLVNCAELLLSKVGMFFYKLAMSRKAESEADEVGMERLFEAGYNYHNARELFEVFKAKSGASHVLSKFEMKVVNCLGSHPTAEVRLEQTKAHAEKFDSIRDARARV